jgi:hypothetical protein
MRRRSMMAAVPLGTARYCASSTMIFGCFCSSSGVTHPLPSPAYWARYGKAWITPSLSVSFLVYKKEGDAKSLKYIKYHATDKNYFTERTPYAEKDRPKRCACESCPRQR